MKKIITLVGILVILIVVLMTALTLFHMDITGKKVQDKPTTENPAPVQRTDARDATFTIDDQTITLKDGHYEASAAPGSAQKVTVDYFGNEAAGDLNGDGISDKAFLVAMNSGGTGTFFYVVALVASSTGDMSSEAYFIGDRIAPQTTEINSTGVITVNYADRAPGEPFTAQPSVGKSLRLKLDPSTLRFGIVVADFEGEADPSRMSLFQKSWIWVGTTYSDGTKVMPIDPSKFSLTFKKDGTFGASTDCNGVGGNYSVNGNDIAFSKMISTLMYCEGSQESRFTASLGSAAQYHFTSKGELVFDLKMDSGTMMFK